MERHRITAGDGEKGKPASAGGLRVAVCRTGLLALGLGAMLAMPAPAQSQGTTPPRVPTATQPAQTPPPAPPLDESKPKTVGDYTVQESVEFGYRESMVSGNTNNYDTFENLGSGLRLFDYTVNMRSIDHKGLFFDNLTFSNFGYGGDPNDVSRLHIDKNKWFDFRATFRRDKNFWNYNLLANPLNPASSNPAVPILNSPQALYLSRRMQDYDLTLFPQSELRFRLGYSHNSNEGPVSGTVEGGTEPLLSQMLLYRTDSARIGVDYRGLPKTTLSFDELLTYSSVDTTVTDNNLTYQLSNGTPVDLGLVFNTVGSVPCAHPVTNASTTPPTVTASCNGILSYSQVQDPRSSFPTERASFQSTYLKNFSMAGSAGYSGGNNSIANFSEINDGWATRTVTRESTTGGPAQAKRVSLTANWSGDYHFTSKLDLFDQVSFDDWRTPSMWATGDTNLFGTPPAAPGQAGLLLPISMVTPANFSTVCPMGAVAPFYNGPNCPQHTSSSGADVTNELVSQFLGQHVLTNTIELRYDFTRRLSGSAGYLFRARTISDFSATWDTGEIYFPGGATGTVANDFLAARGDCAKVAGALPAGCVLNPNGSIQEGSPTNLVPEAANDSSRNITDIHESAALLGITARPVDALRLGADFMFGYNDNSFTRISPRQLQSYKIHANYTPAPWATIGGAVDIHENRDNVSMVNNLEHGRTYSFVVTLAPKGSFYIDFGYNYMNMFSQTFICFADTGSAIFTSACPIAGSTGPLGTLSSYNSTDNYAYADVMWKPIKRVTTLVGYAGSMVHGNTTFLSALSPTGTLDFNYLKPMASVAIDIYRGLSYKAAWNYYGYNNTGPANPVALAALPSQSFNGNNITFSLKYLF